MKVGLLSLGCARTLVDSEVALGGLLRAGYDYCEDVTKADIAIVNTCGFTDEAKQESINAILELAKLKKENRIQALVIMGCLSQRYGKELAQEIKEADAIIGTNSYGELAKVLEPLRRRQKVFEVQPRPGFLLNQHSPRKRLTPHYTTYVKISEGCINACSYCAIPFMKGPHRSRTIEDILEEVRHLQATGPLSEINLIGQDTAAYGYDLERKLLLSDLIHRLSALAPETWIRPLYAHPAHVTDELIHSFSTIENLCRYVDLPIEHSDPGVLKRMNRGCTRQKMDEVIHRLRKIPGMVLRTAVIVGFPGETDKEFENLLDYMKEIRFERLGAFVYSREDGTKAYSMADQIPDSTKQERFKRVMNLQKEITRDWNESRLGQTLRVLIDEASEEAGVYLGRSYADAPEVDGEVVVHSEKPLSPGQFVSVKITDALDIDLVGEAVSS